MWFVASQFLMAASFYAKETGITVYAVLVAYEWLLHRDSGTQVDVDATGSASLFIGSKRNRAERATSRHGVQQEKVATLRRRMREMAAGEYFVGAARLKKQAELLTTQAKTNAHEPCRTAEQQQQRQQQQQQEEEAQDGGGVFMTMRTSS
jgi:hypothetical protein